MKPLVTNEYDPIEFCIMAHPQNISIVDNYNNFINSIDKSLALSQYANFINILKSFNINIHFLELTGEPSQLFTRDIGFVIKDKLYISKMTDSARKSETNSLINFASKHNLHPYFMENEIEGGDVFVHQDKIIVGVGARTTGRAVEELRTVTKNLNLDYEVIEIAFDKSKIHLDCVFNILDEETCILSEGVYNREDLIKIFPKVIEVPKDEINSLAANIVALGNRNILCSNKKFSTILKEVGYNTTYVEFSEIIKDQGSLGCCILPLIRSH